MGFDRSAQLARLYECVRDIEPDLSLPLLAAVLAIESSPGLSVNDLAEAIGVPQQTASRYVSILQGRYQQLGSDDAFFGKKPWVDIAINQTESRRRALFLTEHGRRRVDALLRTLFEGLTDV